MALPAGTDTVELIKSILDLIGGDKKEAASTATPGTPGPSPYVPGAPVAPSGTPGTPPRPDQHMYLPGYETEYERWIQNQIASQAPTDQHMYQPGYGAAYEAWVQGRTPPDQGIPLPPGVESIPYTQRFVPSPTVEGPGVAQPTPSIEQAVTAAPGVTKATSAEDKSWEQRFYDEHGRAPNQKDRMDREWSEQHAGLHGRPPTEDEWKWNYFNPNPDLMKKYFPSAGGGGYYATAAAQPEEDIPEPLGELSWWGPSGAPPMLRPWSVWLQEMVEANRLTPVAFPFDLDEAAEAAETQELEETQAVYPVEGYTSTRGVLERIQGLLGLEYGEEATPTEKWQSFINVLPEADFEAQQLIASLRYVPEQGWHTVDIGQLVNPRYL